MRVPFLWRQGRLVAVALLASQVAGCGSSAPPPPRSSDEIFQEQQQLPAVYLTEPGGKRIIAPRGEGVFVDKESGKIAWPALACLRPECPARGPDGEPYLFTSPDPMLHVGPDGAIHADTRNIGKEPPHAGQCPKCWEQRDVQSETRAQKQQYIDWVQPYVLPETQERLAELEKERLRSVRRERHEATKHSSAPPAEEEGE